MESTNKFIIVFERIKPVTDIRNLYDLAKKVGSTQPTASKKKAKKEFPIDWAYKIGKKYNLLTEWIMEGTGPMRPSRQVTEEDEIVRDIKEWLDELTTEDKRKKIWFEIQFEEKFPEFKEWLKKRDSDSEYMEPQKKTA